jgi:hypothetical protein
MTLLTPVRGLPLHPVRTRRGLLLDQIAAGLRRARDAVLVLWTMSALACWIIVIALVSMKGTL